MAWLHGWTKASKEQRQADGQQTEAAVRNYGQMFFGDYGWAHEALLDDPNYAQEFATGGRFAARFSMTSIKPSPDPPALRASSSTRARRCGELGSPRSSAIDRDEAGHASS